MQDEQEKSKSEDKMKKEPMYVLKQDLFVGRSLYDSYNYFNHIISDSSKTEYYNLCKTIEFGVQLLPDITKKDDRLLIEKICGKELMENETTAISKLYKDACLALENEVLKHPYQNYKFGDPASRSFPNYHISADDAGSVGVQCDKDRYDSTMVIFRESQYDGHLKNLREIKNQISHYLTKYEIIPKKKPSFKEVMEETRLENYKKRHEVK